MSNQQHPGETPAQELVEVSGPDPGQVAESVVEAPEPDPDLHAQVAQMDREAAEVLTVLEKDFREELVVINEEVVAVYSEPWEDLDL